MIDPTPLLLLHGVTSSAAAWDHVVGLLAPHRALLVPTALGHRGGPPPPTGRPTRIRDLADDLEARLDALGHERVDVAGNSMGGWLALELARRGRARAVCALSPAGAWVVGDPDQVQGRERLRAGLRNARRGHRAVGVVAASPAVRRLLLRDVAVHAGHVTRRDVVTVVRDLVGCAAAEDLLGTPEALEPLPDPGCPVTLAWSAEDRIFPVAVNGARARALVPSASWLVLGGVGHVPMYDDPALVARTILEACPAAAG